MDIYAILLIIYFIFFTVLSLKNVKGAIYLLLFALPSYQIRFELYGLPMTVLEMMILILFLVWLIKSGLEKFKFQISNFKYLYLFFALFLLAATVAMFVGPELRAAAGLWKAYFIEPALFFLVFVSFIKKEDLKKVLFVFWVDLLLMALFAFYQKISGNFISNPFWADAATRRVSGLFPYPNALALYIAPIVVLLLGYVKQKFTVYNVRFKNILFKLFIGLSVFLGIGAVCFTKSKGAMLGIVAGIVFYALFDQASRKYFAMIAVSILLLAVLYFSLGGNLADWRGRATVEGGDSVSTRWEMWQETWHMLKQRPFFGAGLAGYQEAVAPYHKKEYIEIYLYPHNIFLNFWSETGIIGLLSFLGIVSCFYFFGFRARRRGEGHCWPIILMAAMTGLLVHGLVDVPYFKNDLSILFFVIVGMMVVLGRKKVSGIDKNGV